MQKLISAIWAVSITAFSLDLSAALSVLIARVGRGEEFWTATGRAEACFASAILAALAWLLATAHDIRRESLASDSREHV
jgi:hypothetical protein